jgi:lipopolysaccharide export system permease protein
MTLKWYLARRFLLSILGVCLLCATLIFMIDFIELLRQSSKRGGVSVFSLVYMTLLRLPAYSEVLLSFAVLVGALATLLGLSRKSELPVMRAGGMSVWQFLMPGLFVAFTLGVLCTTVYNPMASRAHEESEKQFAVVFGKEGNVLKTKTAGSWLRQDGEDGQSILSAAAVSEKGIKLQGVVAYVFDKQGQFSERVDAKEARLMDGHWQLTDALVAKIGRQPEKFQTYLISTYLTPERATDALGDVISVSFWEIPGLIELAEKAALSSNKLRVQYQMLLARPILCLAMVLLAATVSLRSFRSGGIQTMVIAGMVGGLGFFLISEVSRQVGVAGLASPIVAIWLPIVGLILASITVLLHQEDG